MPKSAIFALATYLEWVWCALFQAWDRDKNESKVKHSSQSFPAGKDCICFQAVKRDDKKNKFITNLYLERMPPSRGN